MASAGRQPEGQVEILVVEEDPLVEAADRVEGALSVEGGAPGRAERVGRPGQGLERFAMQMVKPHQGRVGDDAGGVNEARVAFLDKHPGDGVDPFAELGEERFDEGRLGLGVVVEKDQRVAWVSLDSSVQRPTEAEIFAEAHQGHLREALGDQLVGAVARAVVDDYQVDLLGLRKEALQRSDDKLSAVEVRDVDRGTHRGTTASDGRRAAPWRRAAAR